jgi:hypothetical protein
MVLSCFTSGFGDRAQEGQVNGTSLWKEMGCRVGRVSEDRDYETNVTESPWDARLRV